MISGEDVRRLLEADDPEATLTIVGGRPVVSGGGDDESGGLSVISRADLVARSGDRLESEQGIEEIAAELDVAVRELGG